MPPSASVVARAEGATAQWATVNDAVAVGLITSVSTLTGVGLAGAVSAWITRSQLRHQADLAAVERGEQRAARHRELRRDAYVHFLSRADEAYRRLDQRWSDPPPREPESARRDPVYRALRALDEAHNRVLLEGPGEVAEQAGFVVSSISDEYRGQRQAISVHLGAEEGVAELEPARHSAAIAARIRRRADFIQIARLAVGGDIPPSP
jgi:hypothetical protein